MRDRAIRPCHPSNSHSVLLALVLPRGTEGSIILVLYVCLCVWARARMQTPPCQALAQNWARRAETVLHSQSRYRGWIPFRSHVQSARRSSSRALRPSCRTARCRPIRLLETRSAGTIESFSVTSPTRAYLLKSSYSGVSSTLLKYVEREICFYKKYYSRVICIFTFLFILCCFWLFRFLKPYFPFISSNVCLHTSVDVYCPSPPPQISFWRVQTMLFFGLHLLIVAAFCTTGGGCPGDNPTAYWHSPVLTLAVCYVLVDAYEIVFVTWRKIFVQCHLLTVVSTLGRAFLKGVMLVWLVTNYPSDIFINSARCAHAEFILVLSTFKV